MHAIAVLPIKQLERPSRLVVLRRTRMARLTQKRLIRNVNQVLKESGKDIDDGSSQGHPSFIKIKTAHELYKAQLTQLALQERKGQLINKEMVKAQIFKLGRQVRDSWVNWPARIAPLMAKELEVDEHALHTILEKYVREHLNDIGEGKLKLD
jgi:phage terminase Nu1 subunit (DNA packaging protein)